MPSLRPASASDSAFIKSLIRQVQINPLDLDWRRFVLAICEHGKTTGCGQVKPHRDGSRELASIAVVPEWRGRGVARLIIEHLIRENPGPLYLTCRAALGPLYEKFGFRVLQPAEMPPYFRRISRLARLFMPPGSAGLLVMGRNIDTLKG